MIEIKNEKLKYDKIISILDIISNKKRKKISNFTIDNCIITGIPKELSRLDIIDQKKGKIFGYKFGDFISVTRCIFRSKK